MQKARLNAEFDISGFYQMEGFWSCIRLGQYLLPKEQIISAKDLAAPSPPEYSGRGPFEGIREELWRLKTDLINLV